MVHGGNGRTRDKDTDYRALNESIERFIDIYTDTKYEKTEDGSVKLGKPSDCIERSVKEMGYEKTAEVVATIAEYHDWGGDSYDGRIYRENIEWARKTGYRRNVTEHIPGEAIYRIDKIHPAHVDQLCSEIQLEKYKSEKSKDKEKEEEEL